MCRGGHNVNNQVVPPSSGVGAPASGITPGTPPTPGGWGMNMPPFDPASVISNAQRNEPTILSQLGRGVLDTTILGQARRAPSNLATATTLGGS